MVCKYLDLNYPNLYHWYLEKPCKLSERAAQRTWESTEIGWQEWITLEKAEKAMSWKDQQVKPNVDEISLIFCRPKRIFIFPKVLGLIL